MHTWCSAQVLDSESDVSCSFQHNSVCTCVSHGLFKYFWRGSSALPFLTFKSAFAEFDFVESTIYYQPAVTCGFYCFWMFEICLGLGGGLFVCCFFFLNQRGMVFVGTYSFSQLQILRGFFKYITGFRQNLCLKVCASLDCRLSYSLKGM